MSATYARVRYALETTDFTSLLADGPIDERDSLLTLLAIYRAPAEFAAHPTLVALRERLEAYLQHTLDQRVQTGGPLEPDELLARFAATRERFLDWLMNAADDHQRKNFSTLARGAYVSDDLPLSVLYRLALDAMLDASKTLRPEQAGSQALIELGELPLATSNEPERVVRGARWRDDVDARFLRDVHTLLATRELLCA